MNNSPIDYLVTGFLKAIYAVSPSERIDHAITPQYLQRLFSNKYGIYALTDELVDLSIKRMENLGLLNVVVDPYADTLIETSDNKILEFYNQTDIQVFSRSWLNDEWLTSAFANDKLWDDLGRFAEGVSSVESIPSSDGFVRIDHNSAVYIEAENALLTADEALRGDNELMQRSEVGSEFILRLV